MIDAGLGRGGLRLKSFWVGVPGLISQVRNLGSSCGVGWATGSDWGWIAF